MSKANNVKRTPQGECPQAGPPLANSCMRTRPGEHPQANTPKRTIPGEHCRRAFSQRSAPGERPQANALRRLLAKTPGQANQWLTKRSGRTKRSVIGEIPQARRTKRTRRARRPERTQSQALVGLLSLQAGLGPRPGQTNTSATSRQANTPRRAPPGEQAAGKHLQAKAFGRTPGGEYPQANEEPQDPRPEAKVPRP